MSAVYRLKVQDIHASVGDKGPIFDKTAVDNFWNCYRRRKDKSHTFDGPMFEVESVILRQRQMHLVMRKSRYAEFVYARAMGKQFGICHPATCFYSQAGMILLLKASVTTDRPGLLSFPGGVLDESDLVGNHLNIAGCAARENAEEVGLSRESYSFDDEAVIVRGARDLRLSIVFFVRISKWKNFIEMCKANMNRTEVDDVRQVARDELGRLPLNLNEYIMPATEAYFC